MNKSFFGALLFSSVAFAAPVSFPTTTLVGGLTGWPAAHQPSNLIHLASTAAVIPGINPISTSGIGNPAGHTNAILMVDTEAMCVTGAVMPGNLVPVERGCQGTAVTGHPNGATVYVGPPSYYPLTIPRGTCDVNSLPVLPVIYIETAGVYNCIDSFWVFEGLASKVKSNSPAVWHASKKPWYKRVGDWLGRQLGSIQGGPGGVL